MPKSKTSLAVGLIALLGLAGCGESATDTDFYINVGIANSTDQFLEITLMNGSNTEGPTLYAPGYSSLEIGGTSGDDVQLTVLNPVSHSITCTATNAIVGTIEYGQVSFWVESPSGAFMSQCTSGWLQSP